jgi:glycosyltransferase involved in cell wall biosynthesis
MEAFQKRTSLHNATFIPNGLDTSRYGKVIDSSIIDQQLGAGCRRNMCLFLGRFSGEKAIPLLLETWALVLKRQPDAVLVLAGPCDRGFHARLKSYVEKLPHQASVVFPGAVSGDLKVALLQNSKCLLLPSYFESFGNVVLEALASGTPVIASLGTPWHSLELYRLGKWIGWDKETWAKAILELMSEDYYQTHTFRNYARQWVSENYNWEHIADKYLCLYSNIIMGSRHAIHQGTVDHPTG